MEHYPKNLQNSLDFEINSSSPGLTDKLAHGLVKVHDKITNSHPLEIAEKIQQKTDEDPFFDMSLGLKIRLKMERKMTAMVQPFSCLTIANPSLNTINGNDVTIDFCDILNNIREQCPEPRFAIEKQFNLL